MKKISVREMKAQWAEVERQVKNGETFEVLNHGKPSVLIVPARPHKIIKWDNHLETAIPNKGKSGADIIIKDREGRW